MRDDYVIDFSEGSNLQVVSSRPGMDGQMFGTWQTGKTPNTVEVSYPRYPTFSTVATRIQGIYAFVVVALLSGILGVGLYPLLGSRVWCRFFCPLAAIMGLIQKFGRFRITVKDDMCISCGNCSTYCEMGIDVRTYAQNNQSFKRAACVGCGMCAHMCPRGVLKLENRWDLNPMKNNTNIRTFDL
jgi:polyferredoxin